MSTVALCVIFSSRGSLQLNPPPDFLAPRIQMFERLKAEYDAWVAGKRGGGGEMREREEENW